MCHAWPEILHRISAAEQAAAVKEITVAADTRPMALALDQSGQHSPSDGLRFCCMTKSLARHESQFVTRRVTAT